MVDRSGDVDLLRRAKDGDREARDRFFINQLGLCHYWARKFARPGVEYEDFVQEAGLGVLLSMRKFDPVKKFRFITYASANIRFMLIRYVMTERTIAVEVNFQERAYRWFKERDRLRQKLGRAPAIGQINRKFGFGERAIANIVTFGPMIDETLSLDWKDQNQDGDEIDLHQTIASKEEETIEQFVRREDARRLNEAVAALKARWGAVIRARSGLDGEPKTLKQIGYGLGVSRERVRQIEERAIEALQIAMGVKTETRRPRWRSKNYYSPHRVYQREYYRIHRDSILKYQAAYARDHKKTRRDAA